MSTLTGCITTAVANGGGEMCRIYFFVMPIVEVHYFSLQVEKVGCVDTAWVARIELQVSDVHAATGAALMEDDRAFQGYSWLQK